MSAPFVLAVSGPPGSGKSTLSQALAQHFDAPVLAYDAYEQITGWPPERVAAWLAEGAPFAAVPVPGLAEDLARLRRGEAVPDRERGGTLRLSRREGRRPVIVLDTLLGRAHPATAAQIDHLVWLDWPLDVALARKLRSFTGEARRDPAAAAGLLGALDAYLGRYDTLLHPTYALQRARVRPAADHILAAGTPAEHVAAILSDLRSPLTAAPTP